MAVPDSGTHTHGRVLLLVAVLNAVVLILTAGHQIYDTNFYTLWEATALLAGDHPYRDFFEWGAPLQAVVSLSGQLLVGNRLIGEFAIQWLGIITGSVISFYLGLRASRSMAASLVMLVLALAILATTATYHYPKLLLYPLAIWLMWRYMDCPGLRRAAVVGVVTAAAFLFRHDHGVYIAAAAVLAFVLTRLVRPASRSLRSALVESGVSAATAVAVLAPWLILVQSAEGLPEYVESRAQRYGVGSPYTNPYASLWTMNPIQALTAHTRADGMMWLQQMALLVPILLVIGAGLDVLWSRRRGEPVPLGTYRIVLAATLLAVVDWRLFREPGYVAAVAPITAGLAARLLVGPRRGNRATTQRAVPWIGTLSRVTRTTVAFGMLAITAVATFAPLRGFDPWALARETPGVFTQLLASPPIDGFAPPEEISRFDRSNWNEEEVHAVSVMLRYVHDCTASGDRVLVTGQTPFQVGYYVERPIAGGHLFWHEGWRSDLMREQQSLALLQRQSVPFAYSTHDPVLNDFKRYPRIREYLTKHYVALEGSHGLVLVDSRRQPTGTFGALGFPCFR